MINPNNLEFQHTIKDELFFEGTGLHSGEKCKIRLTPAPENYGIKFLYKDRGLEIPASLEYVKINKRGTNLTKDGVTICTVEHLLSALKGLNIDNVKVIISGNELPIFDGSSWNYAEAIVRSGCKKQNEIRKEFIVKTPISFKSSQGVQFYLLPDSEFKLSYHLKYKNIPFLNSNLTIDVNYDNYYNEIAKARTFCLLSEILLLYRENLIKGGSLDNAWVFIDKKISKEDIEQLQTLFGIKNFKINYDKIILNNNNFSYHDEPVRHKILDLLGDLSLTGVSIKGHLIAYQSGHKSNVEFSNYLYDNFIRKSTKSIRRKNMYDINQILDIMPHRYPFLLVDRIIHLEPGKVVKALKNVTINEPFFNGHFPLKPVMPGVLLLEVIAQAAGFLVLNSIKEPKKKLIYLSSIKSAKFKETVTPGDQLLIEAKLEKFKMGTCKIIGEIFIGNQLITSCELLASVVDRYEKK